MIEQISNKPKQINNEDILKIIVNKYSSLGPLWVTSQMEWMNGTYLSFKNHDKFLIIIYLLKKRLNKCSKNFVNLTFEQFYKDDTVEVEKYTIFEISKNLNIPKESARRKINELESIGIIKKYKKKILVDRSAFESVKPIKTIKRIARFLSVVSNLCVNEKIMEKNLSSGELEEIIKKNFSYVWNDYYNLQIPMMVKYKKIFNDLETFHIYGTCVANQHLERKEIDQLIVGRDVFISSILSERKGGINAMSISDITNIPRATVIRKLQRLVVNKNLTINSKKLYRLSGEFTSNIKPIQKIVLQELANFITRVYNISTPL